MGVLGVGLCGGSVGTRGGPPIFIWSFCRPGVAVSFMPINS